MQENNSKIVGEVIAEAREKAGLSQRQLAKKANINNSELSKIEAGIRKDPSPRILRKISNHLDVNYNDLMYMIGLGVQVSPLNPFILNHYANLRGEDLENAWITAMSSIKNNQIIIDKSKISKDDKTSGIKSCGEVLARQLIKNTYKTLLTRGQKGCYIYCEDKALNRYIKKMINKE